jgi:hypothetical protein
MKNNKNKKTIIILPPEYQEVLVTHEMKMENDNFEIETVRNLLYLYSVSFVLTKTVRNGVL